jgi:diaminohydroxyphosphoribosylaminopyrimidine deaminase/5-amino-6-(5-phosphoribosylamino)uracil reductase
MKDDRYFMLKAIELAKKGEGRTSPNPLVGAVIVKAGKIVGQGYHRMKGQAHAEIEAINSAEPSDIEDSCLYLNLEPVLIMVRHHLV